MIFELQHGPISYDENRLSNLIYNLLTFSPSSETNFHITSLLDPDTNFYSDVDNCDYYTEHKFNEKLHSHEGNSNYLSLFHLNIRSLTRNFDDLSNFLRNIDNNFTFVGLSKTWLLHLENDVGIPGYNFINNPRNNKMGGGVGLYFSVDLNYKLHNDLNFNNTGCAESLFIEITNSNGKNIVVGVVYRPPNSHVNDFIQDMTS